jgi:hypothetical protein
MGGDKEADAVAWLAEAHPDWRVWRHGPTVYARWLNSSPPVLLTDTTMARIAARVPLAVSAWNETHSYWATLRAAGERKP